MVVNLKYILEIYNNLNWLLINTKYAFKNNIN